MTAALINLLAFIVAISVLVAVHEFGHYIVGRLCGMKVLRFSIGFGKPVLMRSPEGIEQNIAFQRFHSAVT
jgi:regulator of sigma E protease